MAAPEELPLQHSWVFRNHIKGAKPKAHESTSEDKYKKLFQVITEVNNVEQLWSTLNHVPFPKAVVCTDKAVRIGDKMPATNGLSVFQQGYEPTWEMFRGADDGIYELFVSFRDGELAEKMWHNLLLDLLGGSITDRGIDSDRVTGVRLIYKNQDWRQETTTFKVELWVLGTTSHVQAAIEQWLTDLCVELHLSRAGENRRAASNEGTYTPVTFSRLGQKINFVPKNFNRTG
jgi:hypothetical protein